MLRAALTCCALIACNGGAPDEDKRAPAPAPLALAEPTDAAPPDAPSAPCFALPFTADAERAGIRRLAHRPTMWPRGNATPTGVAVLTVDRPTELHGLHPASPSEPIRVPDIGVGAVASMAKVQGGKIRVTAPAFLDGSVLEITGDNP